MMRFVQADPPPTKREETVAYVESVLKRPLSVLQQFPRFLYIEPINQCNSRCTMCGIDFSRKKKQTMSPRLFEKILREVTRWSSQMERVGLYVDCEPLLDEGLADKLRAVKHAGIGTTFLNSNASLLTPARTRELIEAGLDMLYITIDSMVPQRYEAIRRGLKFQDVYRNTLDFIRLRDQLNPRLVLRIQMILQDINRDEAQQFVRHWSPLVGPHDQVAVRQPHNWGSLVKDMPIPEDAATINAYPCVALWSTLGIHANGDVNLCCIDAAGSVPLGNVNRHTIEDLWHGRLLAAIRELHLTGQRKSIRICDGCPVWFQRQPWKADSIARPAAANEGANA